MKSKWWKWPLVWQWILLTLLIIAKTSAFVVITDFNRPEGHVLFDAEIQSTNNFATPSSSEQGDDEEPRGIYSYKISHHKTQPWVHRLVHLDKRGKLRLKKRVNTNGVCGLGMYPSTFSVYIDVIAYPHHVRNNNSFICVGDCVKYDYVSFPVTVITPGRDSNARQDCTRDFGNTLGNVTALSKMVSLHRAVDDIYVSFPVDGQYCHHNSEKLANIESFLPASVRSGCEVSAKVVGGNEHFFAIEASAGDLVLRTDWCLFETVSTVEVVLSLKCSPFRDGSARAVMSWDQMVHFIIHRMDVPEGGTGGGGGTGQHGGNSVLDFHPIHRMRREMRNQAPFFEQTMYMASVPEEQPAGITVTTIGAVDPENSPLTYSMTSLLDARSQQFFSLDSKSGIISTADRLDREKMDVHYFRIVATDSGIPPRTGTATLQINVADVNDESPKLEQSSYSVSIREGISVGSTVLSVRATDGDTGKNGDIAYSILNPHDTDDAFRIEPETGVISTKLPLDRETRDEYTLIVQANDLAPVQVDRKSATATVKIEVLDENDSWPQFSQRSYNITVAENSDASNYPVIARVSATDADEGVNAALRYSIIGGNSQNHFSIDGLTGEVSLLKSLDFESVRSYRLNIRAIDNGNPSRSNNTLLLVTVQDVNDNAPHFFSPLFQETVQENVPIGSSVLRVQAFDSDDANGINSRISYRIAYRENPDYFPFEIESDSGWIKTNRELDREMQSRYDFDVIAADSGEPPLSATASVAIIVQDVNDNSPVMERKVYDVSVSEQDPPGTPVETIRATDPDENSRVSYEISDGNIRNRFSISTQNGLGFITIAQPLDFKMERKFVLTVKAVDSGGRFDMATVNIVVNDANTHAPVFQNTPYSVKIFEDVPMDSTVLVVNALDADSGQNSQIVYTFVHDEDNEGAEVFDIDSNTGAITTSGLLDREKVSGYILTVQAKDKGIPPMSDTTDVEIVVMDVNDNAPVFEKNSYKAMVSEDVPIGTSILQVRAEDKDSGRNSMVHYAFSTFSDGDGTFSVDSASGIIRTVKALDRETVSRYDLMVLAIDQGSPEMTGRTNVTITILDVNDNSPHWEADRIRFFIPENSPIGSVVGTIQAYDPDEGPNAEIVYSIVGGVDANSFTLNTHQKPNGGTADILTRIELDFESPRKKYDIIVRAASPPLRNDVHIEIHVKDVNDNAPRIFPQFQVVLNNYKDHFPVGPIGRVPAFDADVTDQLQYSIKSGNKANLVYLNETTGLITLSPYLDTNVPLQAKMEVCVTDGLNEVSSEMILQTRMITDDLLFNSVTVQVADMTTDAFLSPMYHHFHQALAVVLNVPKENIVIFSVQEEIEGSHGVLNISFSAKVPGSNGEEYLSSDHIKERVFLNRVTLSKLSTMEILPFTDDLCLLEPCLNFEECLTILKFRNTSNFVATESMLYRSVLPWQTYACRCPQGFTGLKEHYFCDAEINLCFSSPCHNGGSCHRKESGYSCTCPPGFTGAQCEFELELDECVPSLCSRGSVCGGSRSLRGGGGFVCHNCTRGDYVNQLCELTARSFSRGSWLAFPGLKNRHRLQFKLTFATQQRNGLLMYNGRYNERFDFVALEIVNSTLRFSFSLGSNNNVTQVVTGKQVSDGGWHSVEVVYFNKTATLSVDDCDVITTLEHPQEFPRDQSCAGRKDVVLEKRCESLTESCQRFLDLTGPMYLGGLPGQTQTYQTESLDFVGCVKDVQVDYKFVDMNNYVMEYGTATGCPEKKNYCASGPCKNGGKCVDGWGTYKCQCPDGYGSKDCSEDARPTWNLRDDSSFLEFTPQLRQIQFPWFNSLSVRTLSGSGSLMSVRLSNNETISIRLDNNGQLNFIMDGRPMQINLPRVNDGYWHNIEVKWMTAEVWFSLDFGQHEITVSLESSKVQGLFVNQVVVGGHGDSFLGCVQDVRVGSSKNYHRKPSGEKFVNEGCSLATACVGAICPPRSTCIEEAGRHKCQCEPGYVGESCSPVCDLKPCKNGGNCILDLTTSRGYKCKCDDRLFRGANCEEVIDLSCPSTWWGWPLCGPCNCPAEKNYSPECDKATGRCRCKEYHYEKDGVCLDCGCYSVGSLSKNCDEDGKCQCRDGVVGNRCDKCSSPFAEVTTRGCEVVIDGCPRAHHSEIWWSRARFGTTSVQNCPEKSVGLATRECNEPQGWGQPDLFNCTSTSFITLMHVVGQLEGHELKLSPLLSTKLAGDLVKALNVSGQLYGNDLALSLRLLSNLILHETKQTGLNLSHRQDKNFIKNMVTAVGRITGKEYAADWDRVWENNGCGTEKLLREMDGYLSHLAVHQEDTFTKPFEIITPNMVLGLDTVERTWENEELKNYENMVVTSKSDLYETTTVTKRAVRFPKYDNIVIDPRRYKPKAKVIIPLDVLGLSDEKDLAGNAVVGYIEYYSMWDVLPKFFQNDVNRRFNSEIVAQGPLISLSILASRQGIQQGLLTSPIRLSYEIYGKYIDQTNPQCVLWEEPTEENGGRFGWTTRPCTTQVEEAYVSTLGNLMTVNCTCWHMSTYALLIENNEIHDVPRPGLYEDIVTYVAFSAALLLIFGALIALGLLKGPVPATITNTIHKHLLLSIFCGLALYFFGLKLRLPLIQNDIMCRSLAIGLHFFWLSAFAWLLASALHLRRMFTEVRDVNHGSAMVYFALSYAFPLLCVALSLGVRAHHYGNKFFCWLSLYEGIVWGMVGPILLVVLGSLGVFLVAVKASFSLKDNVVDSGNMKTLLWMDLTLLPITCGVWALLLYGANTRGAEWQYAISAAITVLSLYIALGYCVLNQRVKESLYIRAGGLFKPPTKEPIQTSNISRSALTYRSNNTGLRTEDLRRDVFLGPRSAGISTASTTSRSTTKTSSSPYNRSDGYNTYSGGGGSHVDGGRFTKGHGTIDSSGRKVYGRRGRKPRSSDEGSSDGGRTLELASSHSSDDEDAPSSAQVRNATLAVNGYGNYRLIRELATPSPQRKLVTASLSTLNMPTTTVKPPALPRLYSTNWTPNITHTYTPITYRDFTNNMRATMGGRSSTGNSGSDNENPVIMTNGVGPPEYGMSQLHHKAMNSSENLHLGHGGGGSELNYGDQLHYMYPDPVNDLSGSMGMLPPPVSPPTSHSTPHPYHYSLTRPSDSPIYPVQETMQEHGVSDNELRGSVGAGRRTASRGPSVIMSDTDSVSMIRGGGGSVGVEEHDIYGGSVTSGVLV